MKLSFFISSLLAEKKTTILKTLILVVGIFLISCFSGIGYVTFQMSSKIKIILYVITFIFYLAIFIFSLKIGMFKKILSKKKIPIPSPFFICVFTMIFFAIISFVFNKNKELNINTYISFIITLSLTFFVLTTTKKEKILMYFKNTILVVSLLALIFYVLTYVSKSFFSSFYYSNDIIIFGTHLFLENEPISSLTYSYFFRIRLSSIFWEPSVFGIFLIAALVCDIFSKDKLSVFRFFIFTISIIFSQSTGAYILFVLYLLLLFSERLSGKKRIIILLISFIILLISIIFGANIVTFLAKLIPNVFGKFVNSASSSSFMTRLFSFGNYFRVFLKNPILGVGGVTASNEYYLLSNGVVTSETSTFGFAIAAFGFAGLIYMLSILLGVLLNKNINIVSRFILCFGIFMASNAQGQNGIIALNILYFMSLSFVEYGKKIKKYNSNFYNGISKTTIANLVFGSNNLTGVSSNVFYSLVLKGAAIIIAFFTIPIYLRYFNYDDSMYGIWLAITSVLSIITVFDFGMGNGLKNRLIKSIADDDSENGRIFVSTTYMITFLVGVGVFIVFSAILLLAGDSNIINIFFSGEEIGSSSLFNFKIGVLIIFLSISVHFFLKNINYVLQAHQRNAVTGVFSLITNISMILFCIVFANSFSGETKIVMLAIAYFCFLNLPLLITSLYLYATKYRKLRPSIKKIDFKKSKEVTSTSFKFFAVQIGVLVMWSLNEFTILFMFDHQTNLVTEYTEYYKLLSLIPTLLGTVIQQPFWTALSQASYNSDKIKVKRLIISLSLIVAVCISLNIIIVFSLPFVFPIWLGDSAPVVSSSLQFVFVLYSVVYTTGLAIIIICNAFSLFKAQIIMAIFAVVLKFPISLLLIRMMGQNANWGIVILSNLFCYFPILIYGPFEIKKYMAKQNICFQLNELFKKRKNNDEYTEIII